MLQIGNKFSHLLLVAWWLRENITWWRNKISRSSINGRYQHRYGARYHLNTPHRYGARYHLNTPHRYRARYHLITPHRYGARYHLNTPHRYGARYHLNTPHRYGARYHLNTPHRYGARYHLNTPHRYGARYHLNTPPVYDFLYIYMYVSINGRYLHRYGASYHLNTPWGHVSEMIHTQGLYISFIPAYSDLLNTNLTVFFWLSLYLYDVIFWKWMIKLLTKTTCNFSKKYLQEK